MANFYSRLSYSFGNEDWETEAKALKVKSGDRVVCVTASGDRPLNLMVNDFNEIIAIDSNPFQNALFDLKKCAMQYLPYPEYLSFMGADPNQDRLNTFRELAKYLDPVSLKIWEKHLKKITNGVLFEGAVEKLLKVASKVLNGIRGKKIQKLFSYDDIEQQRKFLKDEWQTYALQKSFEILLNPYLSRFFIKDPGLYAYIDPKIHVGKYLHDRLHTSLNYTLAKESVLLSLIFRGTVERTSYPPYLSQSGVHVIKPKLDKVSYQTTDINSYLEQAKSSSFDCYSISDVASYLDKNNFSKLIAHIYRTAKKGARFCLRQFLSCHQIPDFHAHAFQRDYALEKQLEKEDRCLVYRFMVGTIVKD